MTIKQFNKIRKFLKKNNIKDVENEIWIDIDYTSYYGVYAYIYKYEYNDWFKIKTISQTKNDFVIKDSIDKLIFQVDTLEEAKKVEKIYNDKKFKIEYDVGHETWTLVEIRSNYDNRTN